MNVKMRELLISKNATGLVARRWYNTACARFKQSGPDFSIYFRFLKREFTMPSILSHPAVALGLAPIFQRFRVPSAMLWLGAFCTIVPDFDVVGFAFGVSYGDVLGHRGFTHSLLFAAILSAILVQVFLHHRDDASKPACLVFLFLCTASHGVFDALTNGGLGVALFAPFDNTRYFFPWRPIRVSPIGVRQFLSSRGALVLLSEILWMWIPALVIGMVALALKRRRR